MTIPITLASCASGSAAASPTPTQITGQSLAAQFQQDIASIQLESRCPPDNIDGYVSGYEQALADLLSTPEAQTLSFSQLQAIPLDGVTLLDESGDFILLDMLIHECRYASHHLIWHGLYVYSRTGDYWQTGHTTTGAIDMQWIEDRWVGLITVGQNPSYKLFAHIMPAGDGWALQTFSAANGPAMVLDDKDNSWTPDLPDSYIDYIDGYRKIRIPNGFLSTMGGPGNPPCKFEDSFGFYNAFYTGDLTFEWIDDQYVLTGEASVVRVLVEGGGAAFQTSPPSRTELAE